jgi:hypothetical protein
MTCLLTTSASTIRPEIFDDYLPNIVDIMTAIYYVHHRHYSLYYDLLVQSLSLVNTLLVRLRVLTELETYPIDGDFLKASS